MSPRTKLPKGWSKSRIGDVVEDRIEQGLPEGAREFTYVDISAVDNQLKKIVTPKTIAATKAPSRARQRIRMGDVLVSTTRPNLNAVALVPPGLDGAVASTGFAVLRPILLDPRWVFSAVQSDDFVDQMTALVKGALYPAVRPRDVHDYVMPVPPLAEQKRITIKLSRLLKRFVNARTALDELPGLIQQYRAAVLEAACTGHLVLTEAELARKEHRDFEPASVLLQRILVKRRAKWEADQLARLRAAGKAPEDDQWKERYPEPLHVVQQPATHLPRAWVWASFDQVARRVTVGHVGPMKREYVASGIPFLRPHNVRPTGFDPKGLLRITRAFHAKLAKSRVVPGDIVVVRSGVNVGDACIIPNSLPEANCADLVVIQRPLGVLPDYASFFINSIGRQLVAARKVGTAQPHFNTKSVAVMPLALPPIAEQRRIVSEVKRRVSALAHIEEQVKTALRETAQLRVSLFHRALCGKLVEQHRQDNPASELLARIRATKEEMAERPKVRALKPPKIRKESLTMLTPDDIKPTHLADILRQHKSPLDAKSLWKESQLSIDDFYAQLKKELGKTVKETGKDRLLEAKS